MAFDGITVAALCHELNDVLTDTHISKIAQPEEDELLITVKGGSAGQTRLFLCASAALPLVYLTDENKPSPQTAPAFCMLLRKHLTGARILRVYQPGLERVINIELEHRDELGDLVSRHLIIEIMGKHSNIIFTKDDGCIIDSIKHVSAAVSSVREVLPGRQYFLPQTVEKLEPSGLELNAFSTALKKNPVSAAKGIYTCLTGISPIFAQEICLEAGTDSDMPVNSLTDADVENIYDAVKEAVKKISDGDFSPRIFYTNGLPSEYGVLPYHIFDGLESKEFDSVSGMLRAYYAQRNTILNMRQRSSDLRRLVNTALERNIKKYDLQMKQMKDTEKRDRYRLWGELLNAYGYAIEEGSDKAEVLDYYTNETVTIPLDPSLSASQNSQKYYERYGKLKRTYEALSELTVAVKMETDHLESILNSLDIAGSEEDLVQIKEELILSGFIKRKSSSKKVRVTSRPFHYVTPAGFHIYVGKNNLQNDELTFKTANGSDWWFHAKKVPGSHVILKTEGRDVPDTEFELAAAAAAYYSKGADQAKVEVDYVRRREVKKPSGAAPGFVVYYTNYSMAIAPDISSLTPAD